MKDQSLFTRQSEVAVETPQPKHGEIAEVSYSESETPPSLYMKLGKSPLLGEILGINKAMDSPDVNPEAFALDSLVLLEMERLSLPDTRESYEGVLLEAKKQVKIPEGTLTSVMLEKLRGLISSNRELALALAHKEEVLREDPEQMSASKLKQYLQLKHGIATY